MENHEFRAPTGNCVDSFSNRLRRICGGRKDFQDAKAGVLEPDAVSERPAAVDSDSEKRMCGHENGDSKLRSGDRKAHHS